MVKNNKTIRKKIKLNKSINNNPEKSELKTSIIEIFMSMLNTVKLYHWKTYRYSEHEATDMLYKELNEHLDKFIETLLGKDQSRIPNFDIHIPLINNSSKDVFKKRIYTYRDFLINMNNTLDKKKDSDLLSIRDDILGDINQFLYLLTFK